jgi:predicted transcriptional regulator
MSTRHPAAKIDTKKALQMFLAGTSMADIGRTMGVTRSAIQKHLKPLTDIIGDPEQLRAFQATKAEVMDGLQKAIAGRMLDKDKLQKASINNLAYAMRQVYDMGRLERDQSTQNVAVAHVDALKTMQEVDAEIAKITEELPEDTQVSPEDIEDARLDKLDAEIARVTGQPLEDIMDADVEEHTDGG